MSVLATFCSITPQLSPPLLVNFWWICGPLPTPNILDTWVGQTNFFSPYPGCQEVQSALSEFFWSLDKGRMWWYNIIGDNERSISNLLQLGPITAGSILLPDNLVALKRENPESIWTVKRTEWRKFIDCFCRSIEADPSRVDKKNIHFVHIGYILRPSFVKLHKPRQHMDKQFNC